MTNRQRLGYDQGLVRSGAASGLLIWHVDDDAWDQNDDETHKLVDLECADGLAGHIPDAVAQTDYTLAKPMKTMEHVEEIFHGPLGYEYDYEKLDAAIADLKAMDLPVSTTRTSFEYLLCGACCQAQALI